MTISAVLLAGGKSSRMGHDKATISFRGDPLWKQQLGLLRDIKPKQIVVSAQTDPAWRPTDTIFVADAQPPHGPLGGIAAVLSQIATGHLLVLAVDVPFMTERYLRGLCQQVLAGQGVVPMIENRAEPLVAIYPRESTNEFNRAMMGADFSLQALVRKLIAAGKLRPIEVARCDVPLFQNLNQPSDLCDR